MKTAKKIGFIFGIYLLFSLILSCSEIAQDKEITQEQFQEVQIKLRQKSSEPLTIQEEQPMENMLELAPPRAQPIQFVLSPSPVVLPVGQSVALSVTILNPGGQNLQGTLRFSSSNPSIASVSPNGVITGNSPGVATVSVSLGNSRHRGTVDVIVSGKVGVISVGSSPNFQCSILENQLNSIRIEVCFNAPPAAVNGKPPFLCLDSPLVFTEEFLEDGTIWLPFRSTVTDMVENITLITYEPSPDGKSLDGAQSFEVANGVTRFFLSAPETCQGPFGSILILLLSKIFIPLDFRLALEYKFTLAFGGSSMGFGIIELPTGTVFGKTIRIFTDETIIMNPVFQQIAPFFAPFTFTDTNPHLLRIEFFPDINKQFVLLDGNLLFTLNISD